eukprot:m.352585 g.352585  ORF g.352585 m.352585 type:complete len:209 (-) comp16583_c0_seq32:292-918(-)
MSGEALAHADSTDEFMDPPSSGAAQAFDATRPVYEYLKTLDGLDFVSGPVEAVWPEVTCVSLQYQTRVQFVKKLEARLTAKDMNPDAADIAAGALEEVFPFKSGTDRGTLSVTACHWLKVHPPMPAEAGADEPKCEDIVVPSMELLDGHALEVLATSSCPSRRRKLIGFAPPAESLRNQNGMMTSWFSDVASSSSTPSEIPHSSLPQI